MSTRPEPKVEDAGLPVRMPFTTRGPENETLLGTSHGDPFSVMIANKSAGEVWVYYDDNRKDDKPIKPGSGIFLKDIKTVGAAKSKEPWDGIASFYF